MLASFVIFVLYFIAASNEEFMNLCTRLAESAVNCPLYGNASIVHEKLGLTLGLEYKPVKPDNVVDAVRSQYSWSSSVRP